MCLDPCVTSFLRRCGSSSWRVRWRGSGASWPRWGGGTTMARRGWSSKGGWQCVLLREVQSCLEFAHWSFTGRILHLLQSVTPPSGRPSATLLTLCQPSSVILWHVRLTIDHRHRLYVWLTRTNVIVALTHFPCISLTSSDQQSILCLLCIMIPYLINQFFHRLWNKTKIDYKSTIMEYLECMKVKLIFTIYMDISVTVLYNIWE